MMIVIKLMAMFECDLGISSKDSVKNDEMRTNSACKVESSTRR